MNGAPRQGLGRHHVPPPPAPPSPADRPDAARGRNSWPHARRSPANDTPRTGRPVADAPPTARPPPRRSKTVRRRAPGRDAAWEGQRAAWEARFGCGEGTSRSLPVHDLGHSDQAALHARGPRRHGPRARPRLPGRVPVHARHPRHDVPRRACSRCGSSSGFGTPHESNERYHDLLAHGQTGLSIAFDNPTIMGYDSDHPKAHGEVGKCGVGGRQPARHGDPARRHRPGRHLHVDDDQRPGGDACSASTSRTPRSAACRSPNLRGTLQNDILKEYIAQKCWCFPPRPSLRIIVDLIEFATKHVPQWNTISISGYHIREAGSTAAQELAFTLADGFTYVEECLDARPRHRRRSRRGCRSSGTATSTSSRRSPSCAPRAASGRGTCASASARSARSRG